MQRQEQRQPILVTGGEIDIFVDDDFIGSVVSVGIDETIVDIGYAVHIPTSKVPADIAVGRVAVVRIHSIHSSHREFVGSIERLIPLALSIPSQDEMLGTKT